MKSKKIIMKTIYLLFPLFFLTFLCIETIYAEKVTLQLKWLHQAQFAGFYFAKEEGFYKDENLEVSFIEGGKGVDLAQSLINGRAQFSVLSPEYILQQRSSGFSFTAISAIYRRSAVVFLALPESNIIKPADFIGKRIAILDSKGSVQDFELQFYAMVKNLGQSLSDLNIVEFDPSYSEFYKGNVHVTGAYVTGGLIKIQLNGYHPVVIWPGDYRVRFYSDTLATTDEMINTNPEVVERFLRASLKGWAYAVGDPDKAVVHVLKYAGIKDAKIQNAMMEALLPLVHTGEDKIGWMRDEHWRHMYNILVEQGLLSGNIKQLNRAYTLDFLHKIYGEKK